MLGATVFGACLAAFIGGNLFPLLHLHAGAKRAGCRFDAFSACTVWAYWLLISVSAYCALYDLARSPYRWFKTEHFGRDAQRKADESGALFWQRPHLQQPVRQARPVLRFSEMERMRAVR